MLWVEFRHREVNRRQKEERKREDKAEKKRQLWEEGMKLFIPESFRALQKENKEVSASIY